MQKEIKGLLKDYNLNSEYISRKACYSTLEEIKEMHKKGELDKYKRETNETALEELPKEICYNWHIYRFYTVIKQYETLLNYSFNEDGKTKYMFSNHIHWENLFLAVKKLNKALNKKVKDDKIIY